MLCDDLAVEYALARTALPAIRRSTCDHYGPTINLFNSRSCSAGDNTALGLGCQPASFKRTSAKLGFRGGVRFSTWFHSESGTSPRTYEHTSSSPDKPQNTDEPSTQFLELPEGGGTLSQLPAQLELMPLLVPRVV
jgi:hypothetical protein